MNAAKQLYFTINSHLLNDEMPSLYFNRICDDPLLKHYPFTMLEKLKHTEQSPKHHPEGSVWNHTLLVIDEATKLKHKSKNADIFMWAALLHDIGKPGTTKIRGDRITSYDHDKLGAQLAEKFLTEFVFDHDFINGVTSLIRWHMQILFVVNDLSFADMKAMKQEVDINEVALFGLCDRFGRLHADKEQEEKNISIFIQKCNVQ